MKVVPSILLVFAILSTRAQSVNVSGNTISIDQGSNPYPFVRNTGNVRSKAVQDTTKRTVCWLETGTGLYSTDPDISYTIISKQSYPPLLLATNLYDTGKGGVNKPSRVRSNPSEILNQLAGYGGVQAREGSSEVKLESNIASIVPGDTMNFAITYRVTNDNNGPKTYNLYFFYNNTPAFIKLKGGEKINADLPFIRLHHSEVPFTPGPSEFSDEFVDILKFQDHLAFKIKVDSAGDFERTIFITLVPNEKLDYDGYSSVYAVLKNNANEIIGADILESLPFARAHDPNYLRQSPSCLVFPKKRTPFTYRVHFQNTGDGPAKKVRLEIQLPKGMDWSTFKPEAANFAGTDYDLIDTNWLKVETKPARDQVTVLFTSRDENYLMGRTVPNPASNNLTMGDFHFTIDATAAVEDSIAAYADIHFLSLYPAKEDEYELPVRTNTASTLYKECCIDCPGVDPPGTNPDPGAGTGCCYTIAGICWWWWLLIIAVITLLLMIIARRRKEKKTRNNPR